jgi:hypothetical protein
MQRHWLRRREVLEEGVQKVRERRVETYTTLQQIDQMNKIKYQEFI